LVFKITDHSLQVPEKTGDSPSGEGPPPPGDIPDEEGPPPPVDIPDEEDPPPPVVTAASNPNGENEVVTVTEVVEAAPDAPAAETVQDTTVVETGQGTTVVETVSETTVVEAEAPRPNEEEAEKPNFMQELRNMNQTLGQLVKVMTGLSTASTRPSTKAQEVVFIDEEPEDDPTPAPEPQVEEIVVVEKSNVSQTEEIQPPTVVVIEEPEDNPGAGPPTVEDVVIVIEKPDDTARPGPAVVVEEAQSQTQEVVVVEQQDSRDSETIVERPAAQEKITIELIPDPVTNQPTIFIRTSPIDAIPDSIAPPSDASSTTSSKTDIVRHDSKPDTVQDKATAPEVVIAVDPDEPRRKVPPSRTTTFQSMVEDAPSSYTMVTDAYSIAVVPDPTSSRPTIVIIPAPPPDDAQDDAAGPSSRRASKRPSVAFATRTPSFAPPVQGAVPAAAVAAKPAHRHQHHYRPLAGQGENDDDGEEWSSDSDYFTWVAIHPHLGPILVRLLVLFGKSKSVAYARAIKWGLFERP
jgi:hypothetical protein